MEFFAHHSTKSAPESVATPAQRFEPQTSVVSIYRSLALKQLASPRGLPEYAEVAQDKSICGLDSGLEKASMLLLSGPRLLIHVSQSGNAAKGGVCCTGCDHWTESLAPTTV